MKVNTKNNMKAWRKITLVPVLITLILMTMSIQAQAQGPIKIVVVPYFTEEGLDSRDGGNKSIHYRRTIRFINNNLRKHGFEVVNAAGTEYLEEEYLRDSQGARKNSPLASRSLCEKYGTDLAYITWLKVKTKKLKEKDGRVLYEGLAILEGEGYDSAGRDIGAGLSKNWSITREDHDVLISDIEKEVGYLVGRVLTAWDGRSNRASAGGGNAVVGSATGSGSNQRQGGVLVRNLQENLINVRLNGATEYEIAEVFGKVVNTVTGVVEAKRYRSNIDRNNPARSNILWRATIEDTDPFRLQTNIMKMINDVLEAGGELVMNGVPYRYTPAEVDMLRGITPARASSMEIQFNVDLDKMMDADFTGRRDPYKPDDQGFN